MAGQMMLALVCGRLDFWEGAPARFNGP